MRGPHHAPQMRRTPMSPDRPLAQGRGRRGCSARRARRVRRGRSGPAWPLRRAASPAGQRPYRPWDRGPPRRAPPPRRQGPSSTGALSCPCPSRRARGRGTGHRRPPARPAAGRRPFGAPERAHRLTHRRPRRPRPRPSRPGRPGRPAHAGRGRDRPPSTGVNAYRADPSDTPDQRASFRLSRQPISQQKRPVFTRAKGKSLLNFLWLNRSRVRTSERLTDHGDCPQAKPRGHLCQADSGWPVISLRASSVRSEG